jgi:hypothetical protein
VTAALRWRVRCCCSHIEHPNCHKDVATDSKELWLRVRKASRARAPDSPVSSEGRTPEQLDQTKESDSGSALARPVLLPKKGADAEAARRYRAKRVRRRRAWRYYSAFDLALRTAVSNASGVRRARKCALVGVAPHHSRCSGPPSRAFYDAAS